MVGFFYGCDRELEHYDDMSWELIIVYQADEHRYDTMLYRNLGTSGLKVSAIALGFWHNFGDTTR
jgi:L-glyceraldehyde 3-phosphate reductase